MLIKGQDVGHIRFGNTLSDDAHPTGKFDYMLSNPPFGVEWKKVEKAVREEHDRKGHNGRFGPGLPRVSDGSLLFLMHLLSKDATRSGGRQPLRYCPKWIATVHRRSWKWRKRNQALCSRERPRRGDRGPANRYVLQYWYFDIHLDIIKPEAPHRKGKVQLIDASSLWQKMRRSLGSKRKEMAENDIATITRIFGDFAAGNIATVYDHKGKEIARRVLSADEQPQ